MPKQPHNPKDRIKDDDRLLRPADVSRILDIGRNHTYELLKSGEIPSIRMGRVVRIRRSALDQWMLDQEAATSR